MLRTRIILVLLSLIALVVARMASKRRERVGRLIELAGIVLSGGLGIWFVMLLILRNWNLFAIPKILLFISVCMYIWLKKKNKKCKVFFIASAITLLAFIVTGTIYYKNIEIDEGYSTTSVTSTLNK